MCIEIRRKRGMESSDSPVTIRIRENFDHFNDYLNHIFSQTKRINHYSGMTSQQQITNGGD